MRDYKVFLPHHRDDQDVDRLNRRYSLAISLVVLVLLVGLICFSCVDAVIRSADIQEQHYGMPTTVTLDRPAAYRLAAPTPDQMDHLHHVQQIAQVRR